MIPLMRWTCGGESMSSSHIDSRWVAAYAAANWCSYDPSVVNVATLAQLPIGTIAANEPDDLANIWAIATYWLLLYRSTTTQSIINMSPSFHLYSCNQNTSTAINNTLTLLGYAVLCVNEYYQYWGSNRAWAMCYYMADAHHACRWLNVVDILLCGL